MTGKSNSYFETVKTFNHSLLIEALVQLIATLSTLFSTI